MASAPMFVAHASGLVIPNLVAHWTFDEGNGTSVADATGNGRTGTASGTPTWGTGLAGSCMNFDGVDDYVNVPTALDFAAAEDFTITIRVKTSTAAPTDIWQEIFGKRDSSSNRIFFFMSAATETDQWNFNLTAAGQSFTISSATSIRDSNWHLIVGQREGTTLRAYQDATLTGSATNAVIDDAMASTDGIFFGQTNIPGFQYFFSGSIDGIRIYNRALTQTEIDAIYTGNVA